MSSRPPFYILVAHQNASQPSSSNNLRHPATQYHYSDDPALALMPQHPNEQVLVFNYDETASTVQSISEDLIVTGLRVEEAPGAAATSAEEGDARNDRMYIIEALRDDRPLTPPHGERKSADALLARFKRRNQMIRNALRYPDNDPPENAPQEPPVSMSVSPGTDVQ